MVQFIFHLKIPGGISPLLSKGRFYIKKNKLLTDLKKRVNQAFEAKDR